MKLIDKNYSLYGLLDRYYEAKRTYYTTGKCSLTDLQYDALEGSLKTIHGEDVLERFGTVGYDEAKHKAIKIRFSEEKAKVSNRTTDK